MLVRMFVLAGRKTKYRPLAEGRRIRRRCPECGQTTDILACERVHTYTAYFVSLFDTKKAVWVCSSCKEEVDLPDALPAGDADDDAEKAVAAERERKKLEAARDRQARLDQAAEKARAIKQQVEDELAALKARLRPPDPDPNQRPKK